MQTSKIHETIKTAVSKRILKEPFSVNDINRHCKDLLSNSKSFLSKHCKDNPGNKTIFFIRKMRGKYILNK
jgi:hypothetical protein